MQRSHEHYHSARTCQPVRLHATIYYAPSHGLPPQSRWAADLRTLGIPPPSQKNLYADQDTGDEGVIVALWHTWGDSDFTDMLVSKIRGLNEDMMRTVGVEGIVLHKLRNDLTIPLYNAQPLARASICPIPSRSSAALSSPRSLALVTLSPSVSSSSASISPTMPFTSLLPTSSMMAVASECGSQSSCGNAEDDSDDDLQLLYPDSEDGYESMDSEMPAMSPVYYPVPSLLPQSHAAQLGIDSQHTTSPLAALLEENARLREEAEYARRDAEMHKMCARIWKEQYDYMRRNKFARVPTLLEALATVSTMAEEAMRDDV